MGVSGFLIVGLATFLTRETQHHIARQSWLHTDPTISCIHTRGRDSRSPVILFSQLYQQQVAKNVRLRYLDPLLQIANVDPKLVSAEALTDGFCNNVYRITIDEPASPANGQRKHRNKLVAKIFSDLAKKRIYPSLPMGDVDNLLDREHLGPHIIAQSPDALLMEHIDGTVLDESMLFGDDHDVTLCSKIGDALGHMHSLQLPAKTVTTRSSEATVNSSPGAPNMLWHAMDVMLSSIHDQVLVTTDAGNVWTLPKLQDTVYEYRQYLECKHLPCVAVGHGDLKLSNVMVERVSGDIRFIDFELSGAHYRGYDLAKLFRGYRPRTPDNAHQRAFWASYYQRISSDETRTVMAETALPKLQADVASQLEWEAALLEPMTWLEAVSFFLCMATSDDPSQKERWTGLAQRRLSSYEKQLHLAEG